MKFATNSIKVIFSVLLIIDDTKNLYSEELENFYKQESCESVIKLVLCLY